MWSGAAIMEKSTGGFLKKLNMQLPYNSAIALLGIYLREKDWDSHINMYMMIYS